MGMVKGYVGLHWDSACTSQGLPSGFRLHGFTCKVIFRLAP